MEKEQEMTLDQDFDYHNPSLRISNENRQRLSEARPANVAAALRGNGVTSNAVVLLIRHINKLKPDKLQA